MSKRLTTSFALFGLNVPKSNFHSLNFVYKIFLLFFNILVLLLLEKLKIAAFFSIDKIFKIYYLYVEFVEQL